MKIQYQKPQFEVTYSISNINEEVYNDRTQEIRLSKLKRKGINKNKNELQRRMRYKTIPISNGNQRMKLIGDLLITPDGQIRLCSALLHISFGQLPNSESVEYIKDTNCYHIKLAPSIVIPTCAIDDAFRLVNRSYDKVNLQGFFQELKSKISFFGSKIKKYQLSESELLLKDEQFNSFLESCFQFLKNYYGGINRQVEKEVQKIQSSFAIIEQEILNQKYNSNFDEGKTEEILKQSEAFKQCSSFNFNRFKEINCQGMFTYSIGRLNWGKKDIETMYQGYSKGYLDFLGLDEQSLINLTLRDKQVDLIRDIQDITLCSALQLISGMKGNHTYENILNIVTFDGFPIKIYQKSNKVYFYQKQLMHEYQFSLTEIDVDLIDLQNLITYRHQLATQQNSLPMDILIQRELSYKFEDVEYSVHSENFLDKYYKDNLISLKKIKHEKIASNSKRRCKVKLLESRDPSKQIEIICDCERI